MPRKSRGGVTWQHVCRAVGLAMIAILFIVYTLSAFIRSVEPDRTVSLSFLAIAAALVGIPSGYRLIVSRDGSNGSQSR